MRSWSLVICASLLALSGCKRDPHDLDDQTKALRKAKGSPAKLRAIGNLEKIGTPEAAAVLTAHLPDANPRINGVIADAIRKIGYRQGVPALIGCLEKRPIEPGGDFNGTNERIARALGELGDKSAVAPLLEMLAATADDRVKVETVNALGQLHAREAVPLLTKLATDENQEASVSARALAALAEINDPAALPAYFQMLFAMRKNTSFYYESWNGLFRARKASWDRLLSVLKGEDKETQEIGLKHGLIAPAMRAKAAEIEGDLQDPRAVPELVALLKFSHTDAKDEEAQATVTRAVRGAAAEALGRMRVRGAVDALGEALLANDARDAFVTALVRIGDPAAIPLFLECADKGDWSARDSCQQGIALMGGPETAKRFAEWGKQEKGRFIKECVAMGNAAADCASESKTELEGRAKFATAYAEVVKSLAGCEEAKCLEQGLAADDPIARQRAVYALAHRKETGSVPALLELVKRPIQKDADVHPRIAAILATEWLVERNEEARTRLKAEVPALREQIARDAGSMAGQGTVEDLRRLVDIIENGRNTGAANVKVAAPAEEARPVPAKAAAPQRPAKSKRHK